MNGQKPAAHINICGGCSNDQISYGGLNASGSPRIVTVTVGSKKSHR